MVQVTKFTGNNPLFGKQPFEIILAVGAFPVSRTEKVAWTALYTRMDHQTVDQFLYRKLISATTHLRMSYKFGSQKW